MALLQSFRSNPHYSAKTGALKELARMLELSWRIKKLTEVGRRNARGDRAALGVKPQISGTVN